MRDVAIFAQGDMGAGLAARLSENGVRVLTSLEGRSAASRSRAASAGMIDKPVSDLAAAGLFLSVVPPSEAVATARRFAPLLAGSDCAYVDCNAVNRATVLEVADVVQGHQVAFADAAIFGGPPAPGRKGPTLHACGTAAPRFAELAAFGLDIRVMEAPLGAASTLKMCYAAITKGLAGIAGAMFLAAERAGAGPALIAEVAESQKVLDGWLRQQVPIVPPRAYRWVGEMEEIAGFLEEGFPEAAGIYHAMARQFARVAADHAGEGTEREILERMLGGKE